MGSGLQAALLVWAVAAPLCVLSWAIWTGRLRWMEGHTAEIAVTVLPASAGSLTLVGLATAVGQRWLLWLGLAMFAAGFALMIVETIARPRWLQPVWYREEQAVRRDPRGLGGALRSPAARRPRRPTGLGTVHLERDATAVTTDTDRTVVPAVRAGRHGRVFLLDRHVAFVQDEVERLARGDLEPVVLHLADLDEVSVIGPPGRLVRWWRRARRDVRHDRLLRMAAGREVLEVRVDEPDLLLAAIRDRAAGQPRGRQGPGGWSPS